jgi:hypothetical protein
MDFTSVLVVTEVIFEFYWEKFLCKGHILRVRLGPGWAGLGRAGPKKSWTTLGQAGPQKSGPFRALEEN